MSKSQTIKIYCSDEEFALIQKNLTSKRRAELLVNAANDAEQRFAPACIRWVDILALPGRPGEVDYSEMDCAHCGEPIDRPFKPLMSNGVFGETVCAACATSE